MPDPRPDTFLSADTLGDLDAGALRLLIDAAIGEALEDCDNRPALEKARRVTVTIALTPYTSDRGGLRGVDVDTKVDLRVPASAVRPVHLPTTVHGGATRALIPNEHATPLFADPAIATPEGN